MNKKLILSYLNVGVRLLLICLCAALLLATVNLVTAPRIAAQQQQRIDDAIAALFPESSATEVISGTFAAEIREIRAVKGEGGLLGYCVQTVGSGYGGDIELMIGYTTEGKLLKIAVISHSETKGIGTKVVENEKHLAAYIGSKGGKTNVDGVTNATLSSNGVRTAVNAANTAVLEVIGA